MTEDDLTRWERLCDAAAKPPWTLCHHLQSAEADASCPCGYRGGIYGADDDHMICEMGSDPTPGEEGLEPRRYPREVEIANAHFAVESRTALPRLIAAYRAAMTENARLRAEPRVTRTQWQPNPIIDDTGDHP